MWVYCACLAKGVPWNQRVSISGWRFVVFLWFSCLDLLTRALCSLSFGLCSDLVFKLFLTYTYFTLCLFTFRDMTNSNPLFQLTHLHDRGQLLTTDLLLVHLAFAMWISSLTINLNSHCQKDHVMFYSSAICCALVP